MAKPKLGSGKRFEAVEKSAAASGARDPGAVAAAMGRKSHGERLMENYAREGEKRKKQRIVSSSDRK